MQIGASFQESGELMPILPHRGVLPMLAIVIVAACQSNSSVVATEAAKDAVTPESVAALPPELSRPAVNRLANEVIATHSSECGADPEMDWGLCMNLRMLQGFDRYGFLAQHCRSQTDSKGFRDCVLLGRSTVDWVLAIDGNPDTDLDWSKPEQAHDLALKKLNGVLTETCAGKPEVPGDSCMTRESAKRLGLSDTVATLCSARKESEQRGACIIDAHDAAMYQVALSAPRS
jgi:hypothetical protein